jgi:predicted dehydrogenase
VTPTTTPLRIGVIGCGFIGRTLGETFANDDRSTLVAITEIDSTIRNRIGERLGVPSDARYEDYEAMLDGEELDAVLIATPHTLHYDQNTEAMDRGLHVLCEKPLTTDLEEAKALTERAESAETVLMVGYQRHVNPAFQRARKRWNGSTEPNFITAEITQDWIDRFEDAWRTDPELSGGGYLYDTGSHILDAICWTTQLDPSWVDAEMEFADDDQRVDERAVLTIGFGNGATATVSLYGDAPAVREHIHIWDDDGAVYLEGREWEPRSYAEIDAASTTTEPYIRAESEDKATEFLDSIQNGTDPPATARDALVVTAISEAAYESARTGDRVEISY